MGPCLESISESILSPLLSDKQRQQIEQLEQLRTTFGIKTYVNEPWPETKEPLSLDIEHDESGGYVGVGVFLGSNNSHYWFSNSFSISRSAFYSVPLIGHNLISDLETLRFWGFEITNDQIFHDTMLVAHIIDSSLKQYDLKSCARRSLQIEYPSYDDIVGKRTEKQKAERITLDRQPPVLVQLYNMMDCFVPAKLMERQLKSV